MSTAFTDRPGKDFVRFSVPCVINLLAYSLYAGVDGWFVSHLVGESGLAAVSISAPAFSVLYALGIAMAVGAGVLISDLLGAECRDKADGLFTGCFLSSAAIGVCLSLITLLFLQPICRLLGRENTELTARYLGTLAPFFPMVMLEYCLEFLVKVNGSPKYSLYVVVFSCLFNVFGDWFLMGPCHMGIAGAALATGLSQLLTTSLFFLKILRNKNGSFRLRLRALTPGLLNPFRYLVLGAADGSMELTNAFRIWIYNFLLLRMVGTDGVAACSMINYVYMFAFNLATGVSQGLEPVLSYQHGAGHRKEMSYLLRLSTAAELVICLVFFVLIFAVSPLFCGMFLTVGGNAYRIAVPALRAYSLSFLLLGWNVLVSGCLTALQRPGRAFIISVSRGFALQMLLLPICYLLAPGCFWYVAFVSELLTGLLSAIFLRDTFRRCL